MDKLSVGFELEWELETTPENKSFNNIIAFRQKACEITKGLGSIHDDGSINYGFEFSSIPRKSSEFLFAGSEIWRNVFTQLKKDIPIQVLSNCGMHVHVSKFDVSISEIIKMNYFIFNNKLFCSRIANRSGNQYCEYTLNKGAQILLNGDKKKGFAGNYGEYYKYRALNVGREVTIEFRMFASVTKFKDFLKNMQFVIALVDFIRNSNKGFIEFYQNKEIEESFVNFVMKNKKKYRYLNDFLIQSIATDIAKEIAK